MFPETRRAWHRTLAAFADWRLAVWESRLRRWRLCELCDEPMRSCSCDLRAYESTLDLLGH